MLEICLVSLFESGEIKRNIVLKSSKKSEFSEFSETLIPTIIIYSYMFKALSAIEQSQLEAAKRVMLQVST